MHDSTLLALVATAAFLGFVHTITGPDHYIPFIAMARVGRWSLVKTIAITALCGVGHVLGSVLLGSVGIAAGLALAKLEWFEGLRGNLAGWLLLGFGLAYAAWGIRRAWLKRPHTHPHVHADGTVHTHEHQHAAEHTHVHVPPHAPGKPGHGRNASMTPWILFTIFVFGPCEPLIPILMYPAASLSLWGVAAVAIVFAAATLGTMLAIVIPAYLGLLRLRASGIERFSHAIAGVALAACGATITAGL